MCMCVCHSNTHCSVSPLCACSRSDSAGVARGSGDVLPDDAALDRVVQRHDDAVPQLPAAVHRRHAGACRARLRTAEHRAGRLQPADVPRRALPAAIRHRHLLGRLPVSAID